MESVPHMDLAKQGETLRVSVKGAWIAANGAELERLAGAVLPQAERARQMNIDASGVVALDSLGAWLLHRVRLSPGTEHGKQG